MACGRQPALAALVLLATLGACDDGRPRAATGGGPRRDGGQAPPVDPIDGGPRFPQRRDGGAILPPAELEVRLPYGGPETTLLIDVEAALGSLDVHFNVDTTASIGGEIDTLQATLTDVVIPRVRERVPDTSFGVSRFADFPGMPFGAPNDEPFSLSTPVTSDIGRVASAVAALDQPLDNGGDVAEAGAESLYQVATGEGYEGGGATIAPYDGRAAPGGGTGGGVGYRESSLRTVLQITDASTHDASDYSADFPDTHGLDEAIDRLVAEGIRVLGIASNPEARTYLDRVAIETGATIAPDEAGTCRTGRNGVRRPSVMGTCPLVFDVDETGAGLDEAIVDGLVGLVSQLAFGSAWGRVEDDRLGFVRRVRADRAEVPEGAAEPELTDENPVDGIADTFRRVPSGSRLFFAFDLRNDVIRAADYEQVFRLRLVVEGDGLVLAERVVRVIIPIDARDP